jgi:hypothetical protein
MPVLSINNFYRSVEFASSAGGNALLGFSYKYKWNDQINLWAISFG